MQAEVPHLTPVAKTAYDFVTGDSEYERWMMNRIRPWDGASTPEVALVGIPFDGAILTWPGARFAPVEIRKTFQWQQTFNPEFDVDISDLDIADFGDVEVLNTDVVGTWNRVEETMTAIRKLGAFPLVFGGDHSLEFPSVKALCNVIEGNVGLIRIDSHEDFCRSGTGAGGADQESSGVPVRRILEIEGQPVRPTNIAMLGQHGWTHSRFYWEECKELGMAMYTTLDFYRRGVEPVVEEALERVCDGVEAVYFSLDVDVLDLAYVAGTSAPTPAGMNPIDLAIVVNKIASNHMVQGMEVMEVSPPLDVGRGLTSITAGTMVMHMLGGLASRKQRAASW